MEKILHFLDVYSGALTLIVTVVYTLTTVVILLANRKSAKAAKEQVAEMKKQFDENYRARIEVEVIYERQWIYGLRFVNNGLLTAQNVRISFAQNFVDSITEHSFASNLEKQRDKICIIGSGQHYDIHIGTNKYRQNENKVPACGTVEYSSNGKEYKTDFYIDMENYATFYSINTEWEDFFKDIKTQTTVMKSMKNSIDNLTETIKKG